MPFIVRILRSGLREEIKVQAYGEKQIGTEIRQQYVMTSRSGVGQQSAHGGRHSMEPNLIQNVARATDFSLPNRNTERAIREERGHEGAQQDKAIGGFSRVDKTRETTHRVRKWKRHNDNQWGLE